MECNWRRDRWSVRGEETGGVQGEKRQVECKGKRDRWSVRGEETGGV